MKAGAVRLPNEFESVRVNEEMEIEPDNNQSILSNLGFEEGELEMFFDTTDGMVDENELVQKYLEIAQAEPYNLNWDNAQIAANAEYDTGVTKLNGTTYTKHDIANDTLNSYYDEMSGGSRRRTKKNNKRKTRKNKKSKKSRKNNKSRNKRK